MRGTIIYNKNKELAFELNKRYLEFFSEKKIEIVSSERIEEVDFVVVIGGDGTLLRATKDIIKNKGVVVFAVNAGSLGFLTEIKMNEFEKTFEEYLKGDTNIEKRALLQLEIKGEKIDFLNEVVVSKKEISSKIITVSLERENSKIVEYKSDGVIVATPTGSTAYSLSAGGPIVMTNIDAMIVTPIAPHNLTSRPIVLDTKKPVIISLKKGERGAIYIDGDIKKEIDEDEKIKISYSDKELKLVIPKDRDYYNILRDKLKWGENLC